ncbi:MAG: phage antirepressor KilAC domain-containing protein, partial [Promethearchaeota archaeon]
EVAKTLRIGPNKLFSFLRERKILMKAVEAKYGGHEVNLPCQRHMKKGFYVKEETIKIFGKNTNVPVIYVDSKGFEFIRNLVDKYWRIS